MSRFRPHPSSRALLLAAAGLSVTGWLASCSRPLDTTRRSAEQPARDVRLVEPLAPASVSVSDLEAGRPPRSTPEPRARTRKPSPVAKVVVAAPEPAPALSTTEAPVLELVAAPAASSAPEEEVEVVKALPIQPVYTVDVNPPPMRGDGRGPIIIRGGRGGFHDPCDLHRPGVGRFPIGISRGGWIR